MAEERVDLFYFFSITDDPNVELFASEEFFFNSKGFYLS